MSQHLVSRRSAVLGLPALAATPAAALSLPSDNSEFWSAVARYKAVCARMRATKGATDEELDANLDEAQSGQPRSAANSRERHPRSDRVARDRP